MDPSIETHLDYSITALTHGLFVFFLTRAAQKLNITSRKKKKHPTPELEVPPFPTNFGGVIQLNPPPAPPCLLRPNMRLQNPALCKVGTNIFTFLAFRCHLPVQGSGSCRAFLQVIGPFLPDFLAFPCPF